MIVVPITVPSRMEFRKQEINNDTSSLKGMIMKSIEQATTYNGYSEKQIGIIRSETIKLQQAK